ncbi:class I SAM-dependent methyltransferase [Amycolatopsis anabasis]|uniref:class I SAM-dependent methyltransferase n=1 Tax=Amycolatopsis anabasis TaxID=1840409 RepID=UPI00131AB7BF|nr:methyltransferase domain-containing protein [Amycolatopsis anabasis]
MPDVRAMWSNRTFEAIVGAAYDYGIEHEWVAMTVGRALFGTDAGRIYASINAIGALPDGAAVLDVPCGGGIALRGVRSGQRVRYVAADISVTMLDRSRRRAAGRGLDMVEFVEADIERLPFPDAEFDLAVCFNGLHCLPDPPAAVREIARCLKPGGRLIGDCVVRSERLRSDAWLVGARAAGIFGPSGTADELRDWFTAAGLDLEVFELSGAVAHFVATTDE